MTILNYHTIVIDRQSPFNPDTVSDDVLQRFDCEKLDIFLWHNHECFVQNLSPEYTINLLLKLTETFRKFRPKWRVFLLANSWWQTFDQDIRNIKFDGVLYTDYFLYQVYKELVINNQNPINQTWHESDQFLFLTGRPERSNRIRLFVKLLSKNLIKNSKYSLFAPTDIKKVYQYASHKSTKWLENLFAQYATSPDKVKTQHGAYLGVPYNVNLYSDTAFSIISESLMNNDMQPWLTEKTWRCIVNRHPFIMAGNPGSLKLLNQMGFMTWQYQLPHSNYDNIIDVEQRLDAVVENTIYWQKNIGKCAEYIKQSVDHNFEVLGNKYQNNLNTIQQFIMQHQLTMTVDELIPTSISNFPHALTAYH